MDNMKCYKILLLIIIFTTALLITFFTAHLQIYSPQETYNELLCNVYNGEQKISYLGWDKKVHVHGEVTLHLNHTYKSGNIRIPFLCYESNCRDFLSKDEKSVMAKCEQAVRCKEHLNGPYNSNNCTFLPQMGRHPVALVSAQGSGNTWTRGLLEKATGICTGFIYCDTVMRAHGYVGEGIKSGKVLVVKTHSVVPKWKGSVNENSNTADSSYSAAVYVLRNPMDSAVAEWNRKTAQELLARRNTSISHERHTYAVPKSFFGKQYK